MRHYEIREAIGEEGVTSFGPILDPADGEVHLHQPPGGVVEFLAVDTDVADAFAVSADELPHGTDPVKTVRSKCSRTWVFILQPLSSRFGDLPYAVRRIRFHQAFAHERMAAPLSCVAPTDGAGIRRKGLEIVFRQNGLHLFPNQVQNLANRCCAAEFYQRLQYRPPKSVLGCAKSPRQAAFSRAARCHLALWSLGRKRSPFFLERLDLVAEVRQTGRVFNGTACRIVIACLERRSTFFVEAVCDELYL